jgi:O-antigen ligase
MDYYATGGQSRSGSNKGAGKTYAVAHNMYLEFFAENGAIGGILFLSIFILCIRQALRYDRLSGLASRSHFGLGFTLALALAAMLFAGLFLSQGRNSVLWFVVGMGFALAATKSQQKPSGVNIGATYEIPPALAP